MTTRGKAVVAMSGGVDSSVAAALMVEAGYDVTGIMLKLWSGAGANNDSGCCNVGAADDARRVADVLGIPFYVLNLAERFEDSVVRNFHDDYAAGRTPNPCVRCNQWIKFGALLERADVLGADLLVTGHYARRRVAPEGVRLLRGRDVKKDQSYVLWMLSQAELRRSHFPVGELEKTETRRIAADLGLRTAAKPDSQEICFVRGGDTKAYVATQVPAASRPGPIVDASGAVVGEHPGVGHFTIGQRKGIGVSMGHPVFVTSIDAATRTVTVGGRDDLGVSAFDVEEVSTVLGPLDEGTAILVQHRAHGDAEPARVMARSNGGLRIAYERPVEAVAPGQSAAFYSIDDPEELVGGGVISSTVRSAVPA